VWSVSLDDGTTYYNLLAHPFMKCQYITRENGDKKFDFKNLPVVATANQTQAGTKQTLETNLLSLSTLLGEMDGAD